MRDLLQLVYEYRRLNARAEAVAGALRPIAQKRLSALEKLFGKEPGNSDRRHARCEVNLPATIKINGNLQPVHLVNIGGGGVCVKPAPKLREGQRAVLRVVASDAKTIFQYQVKGGWTWRDESQSQMGLPFVGAPRELSWRSLEANNSY